MKYFAAVFFTIAISSPALSQVLDQAPIVSETLSGDYQSIVECAYERIDKLGETGVKKTDIAKSYKSKLSLDQSGVRYWEITFSGAENRKLTVVEMSVVRTMWGPSKQYAEKIMPEVRKCATR